VTGFETGGAVAAASGSTLVAALAVLLLTDQAQVTARWTVYRRAPLDWRITLVVDPLDDVPNRFATRRAALRYAEARWPNA
jgi:hypothetical protein